MKSLLDFANTVVNFDLQKREITPIWPKMWRCRLISCKTGGRRFIVFGNSLAEIEFELEEAEKQWLTGFDGNNVND